MKGIRFICILLTLSLRGAVGGDRGNCAPAGLVSWWTGDDNAYDLVGPNHGTLKNNVGLVSWWTGDDHAYDQAGPNHGTLKNNPAFADGKVGRAFLFNGVDQFIETPTVGMNVGTGDFTIEGWLKTSATKAR